MDKWQGEETHYMILFYIACWYPKHHAPMTYMLLYVLTKIKKFKWEVQNYSNIEILGPYYVCNVVNYSVLMCFIKALWEPLVLTNWMFVPLTNLTSPFLNHFEILLFAITLLCFQDKIFTCYIWWEHAIYLFLHNAYFHLT